MHIANALKYCNLVHGNPGNILSSSSEHIFFDGKQQDSAVYFYRFFTGIQSRIYREKERRTKKKKRKKKKTIQEQRAKG
jgi:hypothetical protein